VRLRDWLPVGAVPEVAPAALAALLDRNSAAEERPQLVDVRTRMEFDAGHIDGAVSAPILELERALDGLGLDRARPVVAICLSAHRSIPAVRLLRAHGFDDVAQLAGGMRAWRRAGLPETPSRSR